MTATRRSRKRDIALWTAQIVLALLYLFAGGFKLLAPAAQLAQQSSLAPDFLKFIGTCEVFGAFGLVLPGLFRIRRDLTPLAASGLVIIMIGAVIVTLATQPPALAIMPALVGIVDVIVARGRWAWRHSLTPAVAPSF